MPLSTFSALPSVPTIAVLPFSGYDARGEGIGLGDVIADQLITLLSHNAGLHMISRLSTAAFRGRPCSMEEVAHHLRATYVVSGRYLDVDGRLTVDVEMADAARRHVAWKHAATDATSAIVRSDSLIALELAAGITHAVYANEIGRVPTLAMPDLPTHSLLLTAIGLLYRLAPSDFHKAKQALDALHERLPAHPQPLAWLSRWHLFRVVQGWTAQRDEDGRLAGEYARRALDAAPDSALALTMLGNVQTSFHRDPAGGEALYDQALAINPNESLAWLQKGNALSFRGEGQRAMEHIEKALSLSPLDPSRHFYQSLYASASLAAGEYARAVNAAQASLRLNREHVSTYRVLAIALSLLGRMDEARRAVAIVRRLEPELTVKAFVARSPGAKSGLAQRFGDALGAAGLPSGA
jgi:TolB-like protein/Flp pilus assembly protein TadD